MTNDDGLNGLVSAGAVCGVMWCGLADNLDIPIIICRPAIATLWLSIDLARTHWTLWHRPTQLAGGRCNAEDSI